MTQLPAAGDNEGCCHSRLRRSRPAAAAASGVYDDDDDEGWLTGQTDTDSFNMLLQLSKIGNKCHRDKARKTNTRM